MKSTNSPSRGRWYRIPYAFSIKSPFIHKFNFFISQFFNGVPRQSHKAGLSTSVLQLFMLASLLTVPLHDTWSQRGGTQPAANLDQIRNGSADDPWNPARWVNGNSGEQNSHWVEGFSIGYRTVMTNMPIGQEVTLTLGYDVKHSGRHALDYLTHYDRIEPHDPFEHLANGFGFEKETIDPTIGVDGIVEGAPRSDAATIPVPPFATSPVGTQPSDSYFKLLNATPSDLEMSIWNGNFAIAAGQSSSIFYGPEGNLQESNQTQLINVTFIPTAETVILAWGGHIADRRDWGVDADGVPLSAGGINGSPYHMRLIDWNLNNLGNQDRSLKASAVDFIPTCPEFDTENACVGSTLFFDATVENEDPQTLEYFWEIVNNNTGAFISSATNTDVTVEVNAGTSAGIFTLRVTIDDKFTDGQEICDYLITVEDVNLVLQNATICRGSSIDLLNKLAFNSSGGTVTAHNNQADAIAGQNALMGNDLTPTLTESASYWFRITSSGGCFDVGSAMVTVLNPEILSVAVTDVSCFGEADGTIVVSATEGATITVNGAPYNENATYGPGSYAIVVSAEADDETCKDELSVTINEPPVLTASIQGTDLLCKGDNSGAADLTAAGGTAPYSYLWSNGAITEDISGLAAGNYGVTVTDGNGCTTTASVTINEPPLLTASIQGTDLLCNGDGSGAADLTVGGGTAPYSFLWSNGATTEDISGIAAGNYSVTVTDDNGCTASASVTINEPPLLIASAIATDASCFGFSDGTATVVPAGGTPAYSYQWSDGQATQTATGLAAGTYSVTVTDANGCTANASATVGQPTLLTASIQGTDLLCNGDNSGTADLTAAGGTAPYSYLWSNGASTEDISGLAAGNYSATVTDANGCTASASVIINEPPLLIASAIATDASCFGFSDGTATVVPAGGTPAYSYQWSDGQATQTATGLAAGTYSVTVTDANGCTANASATVGQPTLLTASIQGTDLACNGDNSGAADLTAAGGTAPYSYLWSNGATTEDIGGLAAGNYGVTVTDGNGCTTTASVTINEPPLLIASAIATDASCFGFSDGTATVVPAGGTPAYSYQWSDGQATQTATGLAAGTYSVTVTDANGCTANASATVGQPTLLTASIQGTDLACNGDNSGAADLTAAGGTAPYSYLWSNGAITEDISGLAAGNYSATVTDANGCTTTASVTINEPPLLIASAIATDASCFGFSDGTATVVPAGGTPAYSYQWSDGQATQTATGLAAGTYSVTVTDANGCTANASATVGQPTLLTASIQGTDLACNGDNSGAADLTAAGGTAPYSYLWSNGATTEDISGLAAGNYSATVTDANGCTTTASVTINEPPLLIASAIATDASCFGFSDGTATVVPAGGTPAYSYQWSDGQATQTATGLAAGTYSVTVTDANGCTANASATVGQPTLLTASIQGTDLACNGDNSGAADLTAAGGTAPYSYLWSNGATTEDISGLAAGNYSATVTDANGCTTTASVTINEPPLLIASAIATDASCFGFSDGTATVVPAGGTPAYSYQWSDGQATQTATGLAAGTYSVTVTDANGCTANASATVGQPTLLTASIQGTDLLCNGDNSGAADLTVGGGTAPYSYLWSNGATTEDISGLAAGNYGVTVTDANGCTASASVIINEPPLLIASAIATDASCFGFSDGTATVVPAGGTPAYSYQWSDGQVTQTATGLAAGTYSVTVTDANGCTANASATVGQPTLLTASIQGTDLACNGDNSGAADLTAAGGTAPYSYLWSNGAITEDISGLAAGNYGVTVTDGNGCTTTASVTINEPPLLTSAIIKTDVLCNGDDTGTAEAIGNGGTTPYGYLWSTGATTKTISGLVAGFYSVTIADANGCISTASTTITEPPALSVTVIGTDPVCNGEATGTAEATPAGGTPPYSYAWSNGATTSSITGLAAGEYTVTVTDANGCTATNVITLIDPPLPPCDIEGPNNVCPGAILLYNGIGSSEDYDYLWSIEGEAAGFVPGSSITEKTVSVQTNAECGDFYKLTLQVTDKNTGCTETCSETFTVLEDTEPPIITCPENVTITCDEDPGVPTVEGEDCGYDLSFVDMILTPPPSNGSCQCEGGMTSLTVQYNGDGGFLQVYYDKDQVAAELLFEGNVTDGQEIVIYADDPNTPEVEYEKLKANTYFYIGGEEYTIHTSCSKYILGLVTGPLTVKGWTDGTGSTCDETVPPVESCACDGGMIELSVEYTGASGKDVIAYDKSGGVLATFLSVEGNTTLSVIAWSVGKTKLDSETTFEIVGGSSVTFHTSCSQDITNETRGDFTVVGWLDGDGQVCGFSNVIPDVPAEVKRTWTATDACGNTSSCDQFITIEGDEEPPVITCPPDVTFDCNDENWEDMLEPPIATDNCFVDPIITFEDNAGDCSCQDGMLTLTVQYNGDPADLDGELVEVYYDKDKQANELLFSGVVFDGDFITVDVADLNDPSIVKLKADTRFYIGDGPELKIHTSCSKYIIGRTVGEETAGFTVKAWTDGAGNTCNESVPLVESCECRDMIELSVTYDGPIPATITTDFGGKDPESLGTFNVTTEEERLITVISWTIDQNKLKNDTYFYVDGQETKIHTSCSEPIVGESFNDFTVVGWLGEDGQVCGYSRLATEREEGCNTIYRTWTATDASGNTATCEQVISFTDGSESARMASEPVTREIEVSTRAQEQIKLVAYPNPFVHTVKVDFVIPESTRVRLEVYNMAGKRVQILFDGEVESNVPYSGIFDATGLPSGTYIYRLITESKTKTGFLVPLR